MKSVRNVMLKYVLLFWGVLMLTVEMQAQTDKPAKVIGTRVVDIHGKVLNIGVENKKAFPVALVFIDKGCVISQRMIPRLNAIYEQASQLNVKFYAIISNPKVNWKAAVDFEQEFNVQFPILFDASGDLANRLSPKVVPESYVFDIYDQQLYRGRINDQFVEIGKYNSQIRHPDLLNAIKSAATGKAPSIEQVPAKGCIFESWEKKDRPLTYNRDIEPLIKANCVNCHRPNDIGPFPLQTFEDVSRRGRMVEYVTRKKFMPIWKAEVGYGSFSNEHTLSTYQIGLIRDWVNAGMPQGEADDLMPGMAKGAEWKLGEPDVVLTMEPYDLPAEGEDQYRVFVIKNAIPAGKVLKAIDFKPGDKSVVHHTTIFVDYNNKLRKYDAEDPKPGYDAFEKGGTMEFGSAVPVCGWAPGVEPYQYPDNVGFYVEKGADLAFENHYHLSGKATTDQSSVGLYFADKMPEKFITGSIMGSQRLHIAANDNHYQKTIWTYVPTDIELFDLTPHMHYIGTDVVIDIIRPNGVKEPLLHVNDWDLRWQGVYTLRELKPISKGSIITATFTYDNSEDNHDNPYYPPRDMFWGWGSNDEMCEVYFSYVPKHVRDYGKMVTASFASFEHTYPHQERRVVNDRHIEAVAMEYGQADLWSKEGQVLLMSIIESGYGTQAIKILKQAKGVNKVNLAHLTVENAVFEMDVAKVNVEGAKAAIQLYNLVNKEPGNWNAVYTYARLLIASEDKKAGKEAAELLKRLIQEQKDKPVQAKYSRAYWELGRYYYSLRDDAQAEAVLKEGIKRFPNDADLKQELASDGRIVKKTLK